MSKEVLSKIYEVKRKIYDESIYGFNRTYTRIKKMIEIEEPKIPYRKKKDGDVSKANKKSKHKHIYDKTCVFEYQHKDWTSVHYVGYTYCSICGKLGKHIPDTYMSKREDGTFRFC